MWKKLFSKKEVDPYIYSPFAGEVFPLSKVNDPVFSGGMMGDGIGIFPKSGEIVSPVSGEVMSVFPTGHAITLLADNGAEIILHFGLDTVTLNGEHFTKHVTDGTKVEKGDLLLTADISGIQAAGLDIMTPLIVTNTEITLEKLVTSGEIIAGTPLLKIKSK